MMLRMFGGIFFFGGEGTFLNAGKRSKLRAYS